MSTEAIGDGRPDAVGATGPVAGADGAADAGEVTGSSGDATAGEVSGSGEATAGEVLGSRGATAGEIPRSREATDGEVSGAGADLEAAENAEDSEAEAEDSEAEAEDSDAEEGDWAGEDDEADGSDEPDEADADYEEYEEYESEEIAEPQRARRWPRLALALGFVLLAAAIVAGAIAIVGSLTHGFKKPVKITYTTSPVFSLKTGDCFDPRGQQAYTLLSCDSPHQAEVFATFALTGKKWPGDTAAQAEASAGCSSRLIGYVNPQLAISLTSTYVYPDSVAWQAGTRTVICEVRAASGQLTGSVRGASASSG